MNQIKIEWNLGNNCSYQCNYCPKELKDGSNPFPSLELLYPAFDHLLDQTRVFSSVYIHITGGEPTESTALQHILLNQKDDRVKFKLITNGSADLKWWMNIKELLYGVQLTYHCQADFSHFLNVIDVLKGIDTRIMLATTPETLTLQRNRLENLRSQGFDTHLQLLYSNFTRGNSDYLKYSQNQWSEFYRTEGINPEVKKEVSQTIEFKRQHRLNDYYGHLCWAGVDQVIIDNFGDVWRGWCKSNEPMGNIYKKTMLLDRQPRVCPRNQCKNGFDLQARKSDNSWGFA